MGGGRGRSVGHLRKDCNIINSMHEMKVGICLRVIACVGYVVCFVWVGGGRRRKGERRKRGRDVFFSSSKVECSGGKSRVCM